jgi:hypothetical protein
MRRVEMDIESWAQGQLAKLTFLEVYDDKKQAQFALHIFWHAFITFVLISIYPRWWMSLPNVAYVLIKEVYIDKYGWKKAFTDKGSVTDLLSRGIGAVLPLFALLWM